MGNDPTNATDPSGFAPGDPALPGELPGNPMPTQKITLPIVSFSFERVFAKVIAPVIQTFVSLDNVTIQNPLFGPLNDIRKLLDDKIPAILGIYRIGNGYDAAWVKIDAQPFDVTTEITTYGLLSRQYAKRAEGEITKQVTRTALDLKSQLLRSYYLSANNAAMANAANIRWIEDKGASKLFQGVINQVAGTKLSFQQTVSVINPFLFLRPGSESPKFTITFNIKINIFVNVYYGTVQQQPKKQPMQDQED